MVAYNPSDTVANQNVAIADSTDCTGCRTVSVAMQVVIVESYPHEYAPANAASASNGSCTTCQTYAYAYQYAIQPGTMVHLSADAEQRIAAIRQDVAAAAASGLSYLDLKAQLDGLCNQLAGVVSTDVGISDARPWVESTQQGT